MNKIVTWLLGLTGLGKIVIPCQKWLSGKKVYLSAAAVGVPALLHIIGAFSDNGLGYLARITTTDDYRLLMESIAAIGLRAAVTKAANPSKDPNAGEIAK